MRSIWLSETILLLNSVNVKYHVKDSIFSSTARLRILQAVGVISGHYFVKNNRYSSRSIATVVKHSHVKEMLALSCLSLDFVPNILSTSYAKACSKFNRGAVGLKIAFQIGPRCCPMSPPARHKQTRA